MISRLLPDATAALTSVKYCGTVVDRIPGCITGVNDCACVVGFIAYFSTEIIPRS